MKTLQTWLQELGLDKYAGVLAANEIDLEILPELSDHDLKELGLPLGPRKKLLLAIAQLQHNPTTAAQPATSATTAEVSLWSRTPGERKPVTMLFADIVGSTALTEHLDAEETHELLYGAIRRLCETVEHSGGTVCRFMGDGLMAMFGAPLADERHALRACQAALAMQSAIVQYAAGLHEKYGCELQIRVGLHSGVVVVLQVGEPEHPEYDASGPTVPVAARLEQAATPGTILLSYATYALAQDWIEAEALAAVSVKGVSEPVAVFRLQRLHTPDEVSALAEHTPLVGRQGEVGLFKGLASACHARARGQTLLVRGEAGIGKTRLIEEFMTIARRHGMAVHQGLVLDFGAGTGQDALSMLVRSLLDLPPDGDQAAPAAAIARAIADRILSRR
jgi:class 3 adenylate cyclase